MPIVINIQRQPIISIIAARIGGLTATPIVEAALKKPIGRPRSLILNQSLITLTPQGFIGASPIPMPMRTRTNWVKLCTIPESA